MDKYIDTAGCEHSPRNACKRCILATEKMMQARLERCERLARTHVSEGGNIVHSLAEVADAMPSTFRAEDRYSNNSIAVGLTVDESGRVLVVERHMANEFHGELYTSGSTNYKLVEAA